MSIAISLHAQTKTKPVNTTPCGASQTLIELKETAEAEMHDA